MTPPSPRLDLDALAALEDQQAFLRRSLEDLDREHEAGDLDDVDHAALRADYEARLAAIGAAVDDGRASFAAVRPTGSRGRRVALVVGVAAFALVCGFAVARLAGRRTVGGTATGDNRKDPRTLLVECLADVSGRGGTDQTVACYDSVLSIDPANIEAQTYRAGVQLMANRDTAQIAKLIDVATANPDYPDAHAFLAVAFDLIGRPDSALAELRTLDTLHPTPLIQDLVSGLRSELEAAAGAPTTTTAPPP